MQIAAYSLMLPEKDCHFISESWKERKKMRFSCQKALKYACMIEIEFASGLFFAHLPVI